MVCCVVENKNTAFAWLWQTGSLYFISSIYTSCSLQFFFLDFSPFSFSVSHPPFHHIWSIPQFHTFHIRRTADLTRYSSMSSFQNQKDFTDMLQKTYSVFRTYVPIQSTILHINNIAYKIYKKNTSSTTFLPFFIWYLVSLRQHLCIFICSHYMQHPQKPP